MTELNLCAIVNSVELLNSARIACWIASSVAKSTEAVASSIMMRLDRLNNARAIATS